MDDQLLTLLTALWLGIKEFSNSVFFTAIAGSLAGAFAGAYGAQRIAEKSKYRDQLLKEMRGTNTAIMLAFGICNSLLTMKEQHVKSLKEDFDTQRQALLDHESKRKLGLINKDQVFHYKADLETLSLPPLPVDILQTQVFEKLSLVGRPISLTTTLTQTVHSLSSSLEKRNQQIEAYKANNGVSAEEYFGLPLANQINEIYPSLIKAIHQQTDDGIYFSWLLCMDMIEHGNQFVKLFSKTFKKGAPEISKIDMSKAEKLGLMPNADDYADWNKMFAKNQTS